ncbi:MAG TPA: chromate resistance protein ChrB [Firmicutes bacterium]|nr:chromate resistance protein ChrB [Bacillota bacterium]
MREWLLFAYTLPAEPSRGRVAVWRRLKKIGAVNLLQSVWVLPAGPEHQAEFELLQGEVTELGGEALLFRAAGVSEAVDAKIMTAFTEARNLEYAEIADKCQDFFTELDRETERENFTFAEVEENEEELEKLRSWLAKVAQRDFFGTPKRGEVETLLARCAERLKEFSSVVYALNVGPDGPAEDEAGE